jgi:hypothetical protein
MEGSTVSKPSESESEESESGSRSNSRLKVGVKLVVFSIREAKNASGLSTSTWIRAGSAWVNRDGSMNVYLDVLPFDGKLHIREAAP